MCTDDQKLGYSNGHVYRDMNNQVSNVPCKHHIPNMIENQRKSQNRRTTMNVNTLRA